MQVFLRRLRGELNDLGQTEVSDYTLLEATNTTLGMLSQMLAISNSTLTDRKVTLSVVDGSAQLPDDCLSLTMVKAGQYELQPMPLADDVDQYSYQVLGNTLYTGARDVNILYKFRYPSVGPTDTLPVPTFLADMFRKYVRTILTGSADVFPQMQAELTYLLPKRDHHFIQREVPFRV